MGSLFRYKLVGILIIYHIIILDCITQMESQTRDETIIKNDKYQLSLCILKQSLVIRLAINISKNREDVYQLVINSVNDVRQLAENFDSLQGLGNYLKDPNHVEVNIQTKSILILALLQNVSFKTKRRIEIVTLPLEFFIIINKNQEQQLVEKIVVGCDKKRDLTNDQLKDILQVIALYVSEQFTHRKQIEKKNIQRDMRIQQLQENFRTFKNEMTEKFEKQQEFRNIKEQELKIFTKQLFSNNYQQNLKEHRQIQAKLKEIDLRYNQSEQKITKLSGIIREEIKRLNIKLSDQISQMQNIQLQYLITNLKSLQTISNGEVITQLAKALKCENRIEQLISMYESTKQLTVQMVEGVAEIPQLIGDLAALQKLKIVAYQKNKYKLQKLPESIKRLKFLRQIQFFQCMADQPKHIFDKLNELRQLKSLTIFDSPLTNLQGIHQLSQLSQLKVSKTQLKQFPNISKMPKLRNVYLPNNKITVIPANIFNIRTLEQLSISNNPLSMLAIKQLCKGLQSIRSLKKLYLGQLQNMTQVPMEVFSLAQLQCLSLSKNNNIMRLASQVGNLHKLNQLHINYGNITELPAEIGRLKSITKLSLPSELKQLPYWFWDLKKLKSLTVHNSKLSSLPKLIGNFKQLKFLHISNGKLTKLPIQLCSITSLTQLILSNNNITQLPTQIGNLSNLTILNISNNKLTQVPKSFDSLPKSTYIILLHNPLDSATKEFLKRIRSLRFASLYFN